MATPIFVSFTSALLAAPGVSTSPVVAAGTISVNTQDGIAALLPITPGAAGTDPSLSNVTQIVFTNGTSALVSGSVSTTASALGVNSPTGPVTLTNTDLGAVALASLGTSAVSVSGTLYWSEGYNPCSRTVTNITVLNGATASTDKVVYFITDAAGTVLKTTALAGVTCSGANTFQSIALIAPITLAPGRYFVGFQVNGTTATHRTVAAATYILTTGTVAGVFGTIPASITPAGTFTADQGPFHCLT